MNIQPLPRTPSLTRNTGIPKTAYIPSLPVTMMPTRVPAKWTFRKHVAAHTDSRLHNQPRSSKSSGQDTVCPMTLTVQPSLRPKNSSTGQHASVVVPLTSKVPRPIAIPITNPIQISRSQVSSAFCCDRAMLHIDRRHRRTSVVAMLWRQVAFAAGTRRRILVRATQGVARRK